MFKRNFSVKSRLLILAGFSAALVVVQFLAARLSDHRVSVAYQSMDTAQQSIQQAREAIDAANQLKDNVNGAKERVMDLRVQEKKFLQFHTLEVKNNFQRAAADLGKGLAQLKQPQLKAGFDEYCTAFNQRAACQIQHEELNQKMTTPLKSSEDRLTSLQGALEALQANKQMEGATLSGDEMEFLNVTRDCKIAILKLQNINQLFQSTGEQRYLDEYKKVANNEAMASSRSLREFAAALKNTNYIENSKAIIDSLNEFQKHVQTSLTLTAEEKKLEQQLDASGESILKAASVLLAQADQEVARQNTNAKEVGQQVQQARDSASNIRKTAGIAILSIVGVGLVIYAAFCFGIIRSINRSLHHAIHGLNGITRQTVTAARQVSVASQHLAEGASEQAASIEETSASLEEMASVTQRNASNAQKVNELARESHDAADRGAKDMEAMNSAMAAIKASSDDISKILKTIDEIAFQTNILALNAAVEAARAGEAGLGFAVVADEVRNLAQRSAQAARETADKIENAVNRTAQGVNISKKVASALGDIVSKAHQVDQLAAEVAQASHEQTQGISQINAAVSQVDHVTQSNAANAEESAAAAQDLNAQAETMRQAVHELLQLVGEIDQDNSKPETASELARNAEAAYAFARQATTHSDAGPKAKKPKSAPVATEDHSALVDMDKF
jgi:methyl-accepting chemotaxis protein